MKENLDTQCTPPDAVPNTLERMFDKFKSYINDRFASINMENTQSLDKFTSPDSKAKGFKGKQKQRS